MPKSKIFLKYYIFLFLLILASFFIALLMFGASFYVHEGGHISFGFAGNYIAHGTKATFEIENWIDLPLLNFIKLPQRTRIFGAGSNNLSFIMGGITSVILVSFFLSWLYFIISKNKYKKFIWLIPIILALHEISGNIICGTDNLTGTTLGICNQFFNILTKSTIWTLTIAVFVTFFYGLFTSLAKEFMAKFPKYSSKS